MISDMSAMFSRMIGTLAVIPVISAFIGGSDILTKVIKAEKKRKYSIIFVFSSGVFEG